MGNLPISMVLRSEGSLKLEMYGDLTCSVHTVNNLCMFNCQCHFYLCNRGPYVRLAFVPNVLSSLNKDIIIIIIKQA